MKTTLLPIFLLTGIQLSGQTFTAVDPSPFDGVRNSSIAFSDVDGDGDNDVLLTGWSSANPLEPIPIAKLYTNDGMGSFSEVAGTPIEGAGYGSAAFSDVDGDGDNDVLITGYNNSGEPIAKLYTNSGSGAFTETTGTPFDGVWTSSIAFSDVDGDGDNDVLITGANSPTIAVEPIAKMYTNNGDGTYTEVTDTPFDGVRNSSIAFSDVDGDGDNDVLITGWSGANPGGPIAKLYTNDGAGSFVEVTSTPFDGVNLSSIAFSDVDGDGDNDVLITGHNSSFEPIAKLYINDGAGSFVEVTGTPFDRVGLSSIAFSDVDSDGDNDVLITGLNSSIKPIAKLYTNSGSGAFTETIGTPFDGVRNSSIAFSDVDGDGDNDVLITGSAAGIPIAKLYTNDGMINSVSKTSTHTGFDLLTFPNPSADGIFHLQTSQAAGQPLRLEVTDGNGRIFLSRPTTGNWQTLDLTAFPPGIFTLRLISKTGAGVQRLVKTGN